MKLIGAVARRAVQSLKRLSMSSSVISGGSTAGSWRRPSSQPIEDRVSSSEAFLHAQAHQAQRRSLSNSTTRIARLPTSEMWMFVFSPSWNWLANSFSRRAWRCRRWRRCCRRSATTATSRRGARCRRRGDLLPVLVDDEYCDRVRVSLQPIADAWICCCSSSNITTWGVPIALLACPVVTNIIRETNQAFVTPAASSVNRSPTTSASAAGSIPARLRAGLHLAPASRARVIVSRRRTRSSPPTAGRTRCA